MNDAKPMQAIPAVPGVFRYRRRVQFAETDLAGIVHFSWYFKYMEEAEHALWREAGLSVSGEGLQWPRIAASCEYKRPLRFEDEIDVQVRAGFGRRRIQYGVEVVHGDTIAALGAMTSVCARIDETGRLATIVIPAKIVRRLQRVLR